MIPLWSLIVNIVMFGALSFMAARWRWQFKKERARTAPYDRIAADIARGNATLDVLEKAEKLSEPDAAFIYRTTINNAGAGLTHEPWEKVDAQAQNFLIALMATARRLMADKIRIVG